MANDDRSVTFTDDASRANSEILDGQTVTSTKSFQSTKSTSSSRANANRINQIELDSKQQGNELAALKNSLNELLSQFPSSDKSEAPAPPVQASEDT